MKPRPCLICGNLRDDDARADRVMACRRTRRMTLKAAYKFGFEAGVRFEQAQRPAPGSVTRMAV